MKQRKNSDFKVGDKVATMAGLFQVKSIAKTTMKLHLIIGSPYAATIVPNNHAGLIKHPHHK